MWYGFCFAHTVILIWSQCKIKFHGLYHFFLQKIVKNNIPNLIIVILKAHLKKKLKMFFKECLYKHDQVLNCVLNNHKNKQISEKLIMKRDIIQDAKKKKIQSNELNKN